MTLRLATINALLLVVMLVLNTLANALPINGRTTALISDSFPLVFAPAGYVFAIWGLIYLGVTGLVGYALTPAGRRSIRLGALGIWLPVNFAANALWILAWHYGAYPVSLVLMLTILVSLKAMRARLDAVAQVEPPSRRDTWLVRAPLSVYQGWISVATIPNTAVVLLSAGWSGAPFAPEAWAALMVLVAAALNLIMVVRLRDAAFGAVGVWALVGIFAKQQSAYPPFALLSLGAAAAIAISIAATVALRPRSARVGGAA